MATIITSECINCGACEPECPNTAIYQGGVEWQAPDGAMHAAITNEIFYIVPEKCTECVGFFDQEACAAVCPVDCCVPDPGRPETEAALLVRARALHPDKTIPDDAPSRFRKDGAETPAAPASGAAPSAAAPAPAAAPKAAPAPARAAAPRGKVEKAVAPPPVKRPAKTFAGELPTPFEALVAGLGAPRRTPHSFAARLGLALLGAGQGILGALPASAKADLEAAVGDTRAFNAQLATAANVFLNLVVYPIVCVGLAVKAGKASVFSSDVQRWIVLGLTLASVEGMWRLRENLFRGVPLSEAPLRGAFYGLPLRVVAGIITGLSGLRRVASSAGFDGFYGGQDHFDDKLERARRYGEVYRLDERDDAYVLRLEFPRLLPPSSLADQLGLPPEMPDYDFDVALAGGALVVHGKVIDPRVRKLTAAAPAFPPAFTTRIALGHRVTGFRHRYTDRTLEVVLPKASDR